MENTLAIILADGNSDALSPLTAHRNKAAIPFGGTYRIIDFTLTNCLHSGVRQVLVMAQYKSHSLLKHLRDGWSIFNPELGEYITAIPPQMRVNQEWYHNVTDTLRQNLYLIERSEAEHILVLRGDQIYRMDYAAMFNFHKGMDAKVTIACMELEDDSPPENGTLYTDQFGHVLATPKDGDRQLKSMGVYLFQRSALIEYLSNSPGPHEKQGLEQDLPPEWIENSNVLGYPFGGDAGRVSQDRYWDELDSVDAYYRANMDLLLPEPPINLYQPEWPIRTYQAQHPPARSIPGNSGLTETIHNCILAGGNIIIGATLSHSILSPQVRVSEYAIVEDCLLFEGVEIGEGAHLKRCIIDKHVKVPAGIDIGFNPEQDGKRFHITDDGVVVIPRDYQFE